MCEQTEYLDNNKTDDKLINIKLLWLGSRMRNSTSDFEHWNFEICVEFIARETISTGIYMCVAKAKQKREEMLYAHEVSFYCNENVRWELKELAVNIFHSAMKIYLVYSFLFPYLRLCSWMLSFVIEKYFGNEELKRNSKFGWEFVKKILSVLN